MAQVFVKTFKGYEDKTAMLDTLVNDWILAHQPVVVGLNTALSHEAGSRAGSGDLIYTLLYKADAPIKE
jgi:hypothetical protein